MVGVALVRVAGLVPDGEPVLTLLRGAVGPRLGVTRPVAAFWMRSSPTDDAADSASAISLSLNGSKNGTPVLSCLVVGVVAHTPA